MSAAVTQFATIHELVSATNPAMGDYVVELYGNTYIHQNPQSGSITAYQQDKKGRLHVIDDIYVGMHFNYLSASSDGRHFAFIAFDPTNPDNIEVNVYYLNTIDSEFEVAMSWSTDSSSSMVFFSMDGKYVMFSDGKSRLEVKSLYTDDPAKIYFVPSYDEDGSECVNIGPLSNKNFGFMLGSDYLLWHMPSGNLAMIDLLPDGQVSHWQLTPSIKLNLPTNECWLYNDYLIYVNSLTNSVDIYRISPMEHTITLTESIPVSKCGPFQCSHGPDSQSVILHYLDSEQRPTAQLVELSR